MKTTPLTQRRHARREQARRRSILSLILLLCAAVYLPFCLCGAYMLYRGQGLPGLALLLGPLVMLLPMLVYCAKVWHDTRP